MAAHHATYEEYVRSQKDRNPCIASLDRFFREEHYDHRIRIRALDFQKHSRKPQEREVQDLSAELDEAPPDEALGKLLIIEDLNKSIIETLGATLNIDPLFFASHLDMPSMELEALAPDKATLPSRLRHEDYVNVHYHRTITFEDTPARPLPQGYLNLRRRNICIPRKVTIMTPIKKARIGLAQHCVSIHRTVWPGGKWLAIILTDPVITDSFEDSKKSELRYECDHKLFVGGYEDFLEPSFPIVPPSQGPVRKNLMDDLLHYWKVDEFDFTVGTPNLISLSRYLFQIVAREWVNYISVMSHSVKEYEPNGDGAHKSDTGMDLKELQRWRRRALASEQKIATGLRFLQLASAAETKRNRRQWSYHIEDWKSLTRNLKACSTLLENMAQVAQIVDGRRSVEETKNSTRLTTLALIFFPLSLFASIFSMTDRFSPGKSLFWVYFAVAIPVCIILLLAVKPPERLVAKWKNRGKGNSPGNPV